MVHRLSQSVTLHLLLGSSMIALIGIILQYYNNIIITRLVIIITTKVLYCIVLHVLFIAFVHKRIDENCDGGLGGIALAEQRRKLEKSTSSLGFMQIVFINLRNHQKSSSKSCV